MVRSLASAVGYARNDCFTSRDVTSSTPTQGFSAGNRTSKCELAMSDRPDPRLRKKERDPRILGLDFSIPVIFLQDLNLGPEFRSPQLNSGLNLRIQVRPTEIRVGFAR